MDSKIPCVGCSADRCKVVRNSQPAVAGLASASYFGLEKTVSGLCRVHQSLFVELLTALAVGQPQSLGTS